MSLRLHCSGYWYCLNNDNGAGAATNGVANAGNLENDGVVGAANRRCWTFGAANERCWTFDANDVDDAAGAWVVVFVRFATLLTTFFCCLRCFCCFCLSCARLPAFCILQLCCLRPKF